MQNPFVHGNPVPVGLFVDRKREIRRITSHLAGNGQSVAVVGEPRSGKTSLLRYLAAPETRQELYGEESSRLLFSYLDAQAFGNQFNQVQFWEHALQPLHSQILAPGNDPALLQAYLTCQEEGFGNFVLERLLAQAGVLGWRLVLMLDEFDSLLQHAVLKSTELFGGLRSLASRYTSLTLVIASRRPLEQLNADTQELSRAGSPYFNILHPIGLGPFPNAAVDELLQRDNDYFTPGDRRFLHEVAGGHPYLLQAAASALWEAYDEGVESVDARRLAASENFYDQVAPDLSNIWQYWTVEKKKALTIIGLSQISTLALGDREFHLERLGRDLSNLWPEIRDLEKQGFVIEDCDVWRVRPGVVLWWLADEIMRAVRNNLPFEEWLLAQEWQGQLTRSEKETLRSLGRKLGGWLEKGVTTLIEVTAKGVGSGIAGGK